jgi:hypothetical protein
MEVETNRVWECSGCQDPPEVGSEGRISHLRSLAAVVSLTPNNCSHTMFVLVHYRISNWMVTSPKNEPSVIHLIT